MQWLMSWMFHSSLSVVIWNHRRVNPVSQLQPGSSHWENVFKRSLQLDRRHFPKAAAERHLVVSLGRIPRFWISSCLADNAAPIGNSWTQILIYRCKSKLSVELGIPWLRAPKEDQKVKRILDRFDTSPRLLGDTAPILGSWFVYC